MSEILFLGTGAADWDIKKRGEFFRRNSAALINEDLMIDCGKDIFDFADSVGNQHLYDNVSNIIITHSHDDHFCVDSVLKLAEKQKIRLGACKEVLDAVGENPNIELVLIEPFKTVKLGEYVITPLLANHYFVTDGDNQAFHYIIETNDGKKIFYGLDGAWFLTPSWEEMKKHIFNVMVFDCTVGDIDDWRIFEHNTIPMLRFMIKEIRNNNLVSSDGKLIASHIARTLHNSHEETESVLKEMDMLTAYDGYKLLF